MRAYERNKFDEWEPAPKWKRFGAAVFDLLIVFVLFFVPYVNVFLVIGYALGRDSWKRFKGQSIGKKIFRIRVMHKLSGYDLKGQYAVGITRNLTHFIPLLDLLIALVHPRGLRVGDLWAHTQVVKDTPELKQFNKTVARTWKRYLDLGDLYDPLDYHPKSEKGRM